jgi:hypothetical protein
MPSGGYAQRWLRQRSDRFRRFQRVVSYWLKAEAPGTIHLAEFRAVDAPAVLIGLDSYSSPTAKIGTPATDCDLQSSHRVGLRAFTLVGLVAAIAVLTLYVLRPVTQFALGPSSMYERYNTNEAEGVTVEFVVEAMNTALNPHPPPNAGRSRLPARRSLSIFR